VLRVGNRNRLPPCDTLQGRGLEFEND
jgi:hypothetical protein